MKTDGEIKEWIDSRDVLTLNELSFFIYGSSQGCSPRAKPLFNGWLYALEKKDLAKMNLYRENKRRKFIGKFRADKDEIKRIMTLECGGLSIRAIRDLLLSKYGKKVNTSLICGYQKKFGIKNKVDIKRNAIEWAMGNAIIKDLSDGEICAKIKEKFGIRVSPSTIWRHKKIEVTYKFGGMRKIDRDNRDRVMTILQQDERIRDNGYKTSQKYLEQLYGIQLCQATISKYKTLYKKQINQQHYELV